MGRKSETREQLVKRLIMLFELDYVLDKAAQRQLIANKSVYDEYDKIGYTQIVQRMELQHLKMFQ